MKHRKNYVDVLHQSYIRFYFTDETDMQKIATKLNMRDNANDAVKEVITEENGYNLDSEEQFDDTYRYLDPKDVGGEPTVLVFENNEIIWEN